MIRVIAELGINHGGSFEEAIRLQTAAADAGCWAVKYQMRTNFKECVPEHLWDTERVHRGERMTYLEYRRRMEFSDGELSALKRHANSLGLEWFASVWDVASVGRLAAISLDHVKVPSAMVTNDELIESVAGEQFGTVFLSTGMSTRREVWSAIDRLWTQEARLVPMACVSAYPCPEDCLNLARLRNMPGCHICANVGYSGHETDILPSLIAVGLGAGYIERHLTMDKRQEGSDHASSLEPQELAKLVRQAQRVETMLGDGTIHPLPEEEPAMRRLRPEKLLTAATAVP